MKPLGSANAITLATRPANRVSTEIRYSLPETAIDPLMLIPCRCSSVNSCTSRPLQFCRAETWQRLCKCIQSVHQGQVWVNSHQLHCVLDALVSATPLRLVSAQGRRLLTKREDEVVTLVADGLSNRNVAHKLGLTEHTVSNYLFRIYEKLGISSRVELVLYALKQKQG
jgi:DNA-binding CsgD family transcriptional regulator